jgi:hypothetical protein
MAGFTITSPTNRVVLDRTRAGQAAFTVANQTGHQVRARASVVIEGTTDASWLTVVGKAERDFLADATEPFAVEVSVPREVPAGLYPFRLDVASLAAPNEEWGRGPVVVFEAPEPLPLPETESPGYLETVGGALLGAFTVAVILIGVGLAVGIAVASGGTGGGTPITGGPGEIVGGIIGNALASAIGFVIVLVFMMVAFAGLGLWLGPVIGAFLVLRIRDFHDPWVTAVPMVILMPLIGLPILIAFLALGGAIGLRDTVGVIWAVFGLLVAVSVPALAARAFARWRLVGHL